MPWEDAAKTGKGGRRLVASLLDLPRDGTRLEDEFSLAVHLPPGAGPGPTLSAVLGAWGARFDAGGVDVSDAVLASGYGRLNDAVRGAMAMAALIAHVRSGRIAVGSRVLFVHTGGPPALFAYAESLGYWLSEAPEAPAR